MNDLRDQQAAMRARQAALGSLQGKQQPSIDSGNRSATGPDQQARPNNRPGDKWLSQFMDYLIGERGYSAHTIRAYKEDVSKYRDALAKDLLAASTDDVRKFVLGILESGLSPKSARRKLSAIRGFYQFVFGEGGLPKDPSRHLHGPKAFKTIIRPITRGEVDQTLGFLGTDWAHDVHDRALMYTLYGSGLRVSELIRLKIDDIDFAQKVAKVRRGKGQKDRTVPMNQSEIEAIRLYLDKSRPRLLLHGKYSRFLFVSRRGEPLTRQRVWQIMTRTTLKAVGRSISPHKYRHAFVTDNINGGAPPRVVMRMVGHSHIKTTMAYMHDDPQRIRAEYLKSHPRGREQ